ncbi:hypothetical protein [Blastococcus brunescens]|uniref:Uncharacterized protein n=1 Tax=Blastococcus brunescens TaxID=1564165 RepID=A0ABZ1B5N0_9ACTN|nr:hypothetical protein [Blastococcus sp. BMG 8361]WRL66101.1 hypothetical protein U6N30_11560 [Blastococcus sp. BMG 8361]
MAGAMRRMGIYLGLVEDDDARGYGRYDARQSEHPESDRRYGGRYADDRYDGHYDDEYAAGGYAEDDLGDELPRSASPSRSRPAGTAPCARSGWPPPAPAPGRRAPSTAPSWPVTPPPRSAAR